MPECPFPHDGPLYIYQALDFDVAYYSRDAKKYKRWRKVPGGEWDDANEQEITGDEFWMTVACIERRRTHAPQQTRRH